MDPAPTTDSQALVALADAERAKADQLAQALEDIAHNGLPKLEDCVPWSELRESALAEIRARQTGHRAA